MWRKKQSDLWLHENLARNGGRKMAYITVMFGYTLDESNTFNFGVIWKTDDVRIIEFHNGNICIIHVGSNLCEDETFLKVHENWWEKDTTGWDYYWLVDLFTPQENSAMPSKNNPYTLGYFNVNFIPFLIALLITQSACREFSSVKDINDIYSIIMSCCWFEARLYGQPFKHKPI